MSDGEVRLDSLNRNMCCDLPHMLGTVIGAKARLIRQLVSHEGIRRLQFTDPGFVGRLFQLDGEDQGQLCFIEVLA